MPGSAPSIPRYGIAQLSPDPATFPSARSECAALAVVVADEDMAVETVATIVWARKRDR